MSDETRIELHSRSCSCRGGAWVLLDTTLESPCSGEAAAAAGKTVLGITEWRQLGKPGNLESCREAQGPADGGERLPPGGVTILSSSQGGDSFPEGIPTGTTPLEFNNTPQGNPPRE